MPRIGKFPAFGKRFFRRARKLIGSCHFQHLWRVVVALAGMQGRRSLKRMQSLFQDRRTRQAISDFLKKAAWEPFGENVEGLSYCRDKTCSLEIVFKCRIAVV